jgi:hypothetical protein
MILLHVLCNDKGRYQLPGKSSCCYRCDVVAKAWKERELAPAANVPAAASAIYGLGLLQGYLGIQHEEVQKLDVVLCAL